MKNKVDVKKIIAILYIINIAIIIFGFLFAVFSSIYKYDGENLFLLLHLSILILGVTFCVLFLIVNIIAFFAFKHHIFIIISVFVFLWNLYALYMLLSGMPLVP